VWTNWCVSCGQWAGAQLAVELVKPLVLPHKLSAKHMRELRVDVWDKRWRAHDRVIGSVCVSGTDLAALVHRDMDSGLEGSLVRPLVSLSDDKEGDSVQLAAALCDLQVGTLRVQSVRKRPDRAAPPG
jgi:hypothetical protein